MKVSLQSIQPLRKIQKNTNGTIVKARAPVIDVKVGVPVTLTWCIIILCFTSRSSNIWLPFQAKNNVASTPASTALT